MIKTTLRTVVLSLMVALLAVSFLATSADAQTVASQNGITTRIGAAPQAGTPNINVKLNGKGKFIFMPTKLTCNHVNNPCHTWANLTSTDISIYVNGSFYFTLPAHGTASTSYSGASKWHYTMPLQNPKAKLLVIVT